ncbi:hypothetical protein [uncultured Leptotrichia sp.]|uniref:hypothetical protein n=1 Tax=uncultured Leptotrichia sp. TaxID=159271 RepID=UPI00262E6DE0|nr:hypothetical protein [uncultured Leptotrichia sp.]
MKVSVELTLSPLQDEFEAPIIHFIKKLRTSGLIVYGRILEGADYKTFRIFKEKDENREEIVKIKDKNHEYDENCQIKDKNKL